MSSHKETGEQVKHWTFTGKVLCLLLGIVTTVGMACLLRFMPLDSVQDNKTVKRSLPDTSHSQSQADQTHFISKQWKFVKVIRESNSYHHYNEIMTEKEWEVSNIRDVLNASGNMSIHNGECDVSSDVMRFDCHPDPFASKESCEGRGCCWEVPNIHAPKTKPLMKYSRGIDVPYCYFPKNYPSYTMEEPKETQTGYTATLTRGTKSPWPEDVMTLTLDVHFESSSRLHFKLYDSNNKRYEVPIDTPKVSKKALSPHYEVKLRQEPFGITVKRKSTGALLFDTTQLDAPLIFAEQFIQLSTAVESGMLFGLGEKKAPFLYNLTSGWSQRALWSKDQPPSFDSNLYGVYPFYVSIEKDGNSHGVFLLNSNAMDIDLQPASAVTYRTIGGILDFYILTGPSPDSVVAQYQEVIGQPLLPPYWALGFHLCRWGYNNTADMQKVINRMRKGGFPYDVQWNDIDYMSEYLDWTLDTVNYKGLPEIVQDLHKHGQHYVMIVDPGISVVQPPGSYPPYDSGKYMDIFIKNATGQDIVGGVWPGRTVFPDFTHPSAPQWWLNCAKTFHQTLPFDGLWTDMNEPSSFIYGSYAGCTKSNLDAPPYVPGIIGNSLPTQTLCPSAKQYLGSHYDLHSLYGHFEVKATRKALDEIMGTKRSLIISRSTFPGTGQYGAHWTGDVSSTWEDLHYSIPALLDFQLFGIPFVGADICGFNGDTTEELCTRWTQLGAFYPFMRNHNSISKKDQDPAVFSSSAQASMKAALQLRYSLLPHLYTLLYRSSVNGSMVMRPLAFQYPTDTTTFKIDQQFLWADTLLVSPVLFPGATTVTAYFPKDSWFNYKTGETIPNPGQWIKLSAQLNTINVHIRGGSIIPTQQPDVTTTKMRVKPFGITVALDADDEADGELFWDDGESRDTIEKGKYTLIFFKVKQNQLTSEIVHGGYIPSSGMLMDKVRVLGVKNKPQEVKVNGNKVNYKYNSQTMELGIANFTSTSLLSQVTVTWFS